MIIYNIKGAFVAIITVAVFVGLAFLDINAGLSMILAGLVGVAASVKASTKGEGYSGMPTIFFVPTHVFAAIVVVLGVTAFSKAPSLFTEESTDYRYTLLEADQDELDAAETAGIDSLAATFTSYMRYSLVDELEPENTACLVKENKELNRVLIILKLPKINDLDKSVRPELLDMMDEVIAEEPFYEGKELYIGIQGNSSIWVTRTPEEGVKNSRSSASEEQLVPFYGDGPVALPAD